MDEAREESPIVDSSPDGELVQRKFIGAGTSGTEVSNLCVKINKRNEVLVGSENGCSLFSLEGGVISVFESDQGREEPLGEVPTVVFDATNDDVFFIASDNTVLAYDCREGRQPLFCLKENSDEINQLRVCALHLASCDDSGEIKVFDVSTRKSFRTLRNKHKNICSSISFRKNACNELVSGSLDYQLILWNYSKIKALDVSNTQEIFRAMDGENSGYLCNPPMINAVGFSDDAKILACGTGNGCVILYDTAKGKRLNPYDILRSHSSLGVSCLDWFEFKSKKYLLSGGNDCKLSSREVFTRRPEKETDHTSKECFVSLPSKVTDVTSFSKDEKLFHLVCDQSSQTMLFEYVAS